MAATIQRMLYPLNEASAMLGVARTTLYKLAGDGQIEMIHVGRKALITEASLVRFVQDRVQAGRDKSDASAR